MKHLDKEQFWNNLDACLESQFGSEASDLQAYALDPLGWTMHAFPWDEGELTGYEGPDAWQQEILSSIGDQLQAGGDAGAVIQEATASGHGIGKSALVSWLILWAIDTLPDTKGLVTANTESQLKTKTWSELAKWHRLSRSKQRFELGATALYSSDPDHAKTWKVDQIPWSERNSEAFAGLHNKGGRVLLIFDEASAIPDVIWEVSEGALTDSTTQIIWCVFGNPTRNSGRFKDCFTGRTKHRWRTRQIDSRTCRMTNKAQLDKWIADYGLDSDFVKVRVRGIFPALSARQFISVTDVDAAFGRHLNQSQYTFAPKILSVDPAWEGDDELVIALRQGLAFKILRVIPKNDNDLDVAAIIGHLEDSEGADAIFIDGGYGTGIVSAGRTMGRTWQIVWFAGKSLDPGYANKRAEMWGLMRDWLKSGGAIPADSDLYNDLIGPETVATLDGQIQLESKKDMKRRGLKSPNRADALALTFAYPVSARSTRPHKPAFALTEYEPLQSLSDQDLSSGPPRASTLFDHSLSWQRSRPGKPSIADDYDPLQER